MVGARGRRGRLTAAAAATVLAAGCELTTSLVGLTGGTPDAGRDAQHTDVAPSDVTVDDHSAPDAHADEASAPVIAFVQLATGNVDLDPQGSLVVPFEGENRAGDLIVVSVGWGEPETGAPTVSVTDTNGNSYHPVGTTGPTAWAAAFEEQLFYAADIHAGMNDVAVVMSATPTEYFEVRVFEYSGVAASSPVDAVSSETGTVAPAAITASFTSGAQGTSADDELIFGLWQDDDTDIPCVYTPESGYVLRSLFDGGGGALAEDSVEDEAGAHQVVLSQTCAMPWTGDWVMLMATFKRGP